MNDVSYEKRGTGDSKRITIVLVLVMVLMITTAGGTYAYLAISANAVNNVTGTVATAGLQFSVTPTQVSPTGTYASKPMVPQYAYNNSKNVLQLAITGADPVDTSGTAVFPCVDTNGNAICKVYTFTVKNNGSGVADISGTISFTSPTTNLKWAPMKSATTVADITSASDTDIHAATTSEVTLAGFDNATTPAPATTWRLAQNETKQFWIVFWINETGSSQNDSGTWYATIKFNSSNGTGVTSTITGA